MARVSNETRGIKLSKLVEWWIGDHAIEVTYERDEYGRGTLSPDYQHTFWLQKRRVHQKALATILNAELMDLGHKYTISQIISALNRFTWAHFIEMQNYPPELENYTIPQRRPGRPKKLSTRTPEAKVIKLNTKKQEQEGA